MCYRVLAVVLLLRFQRDEDAWEGADQKDGVAREALRTAIAAAVLRFEFTMIDRYHGQSKWQTFQCTYQTTPTSPPEHAIAITRANPSTRFHLPRKWRTLWSSKSRKPKSQEPNFHVNTTLRLSMHRAVHSNSVVVKLSFILSRPLYMLCFVANH